MCRSSRVLAFLALFIGGPAIAQGHPPAGVGARAVTQPGRLSKAAALIGGRHWPGAHHRVGRQGGYYGEFFGGDPGLAPFGGDATSEGPPGFGPDVPPPGIIPGRRPGPSCVPPRIIRVGRGLPHPAKTRVIYGLPPCAGF